MLWVTLLVVVWDVESLFSLVEAWEDGNLMLGNGDVWKVSLDLIERLLRRGRGWAFIPCLRNGLFGRLPWIRVCDCLNAGCHLASSSNHGDPLLRSFSKIELSDHVRFIVIT